MSTEHSTAPPTKPQAFAALRLGGYRVGKRTKLPALVRARESRNCVDSPRYVALAFSGEGCFGW